MQLLLTPQARERVKKKNEPIAISPKKAQPATPIAPITQISPETPNKQIIPTTSNPIEAPVSEASPRKLPKVSFKHFGAARKEEEDAKSQEALPQGSGDDTPLVEPINSDKLTAAWYAFIGTLPRESAALAERFKGLQPVVKDDNTAVLTVSNPQVQKTVESQMPQILNTMRRELRNVEFRIETKLEELQEVAKSFGPSEMLKMMKNQNADVDELVNKLDLTFD